MCSTRLIVLYFLTNNVWLQQHNVIVWNAFLSKYVHILNDWIQSVNVSEWSCEIIAPKDVEIRISCHVLVVNTLPISFIMKRYNIMLDIEIYSRTYTVWYRYTLSYDGIGLLNKGEILIKVMLSFSTYYHANVHYQERLELKSKKMKWMCTIQTHSDEAVWMKMARKEGLHAEWGEKCDQQENMKQIVKDVG